MRFTANEDFKVGYNQFEAGNTYSSERYDIDEDALKRYWGAGWCEVEGWDKAPARKPGAQTIKVDTLKVKAHG